MKRLIHIAALATGLGAALPFAQAQQAEQYAHRSFLTQEGGFEIAGDRARNEILRVNASDGAFANPVAVAPHFYWGVSREVTLGLTHRSGLCTGCENIYGQKKVYNDVGFALLLRLVHAPRFELDLHARAENWSLDPFRLAVGGGVI